MESKTEHTGDETQATKIKQEATENVNGNAGKQI